MKLYWLVGAATVLIGAHILISKPKKKEEKKMHELISGKTVFIPVRK